jgi:hypothetical protein
MEETRKESKEQEENEERWKFRGRAGAAGPNPNEAVRLYLQVLLCRLTHRAAGVPIIGGHGACLDQVARSDFHLNAEAGSFLLAISSN